MYIVTVEFVVKPEHIEAFRVRMLQQARDSLSLEEGCRHFDVCVDPGDPARFFLYEAYTAAADFDAHMESAHFNSFAEEVAPWLVSRDIRKLTLLPLEE